MKKLYVTASFVALSLNLSGCNFSSVISPDSVGNLKPKRGYEVNLADKLSAFSEAGEPWKYYHSNCFKYQEESIPDLMDSDDINATFEADSTEDRAGIWSVFGAGPGNGNSTTADYKFKLQLHLNQQKTIKDILVLHGVYGEAWSTSSEQVFQKGLYPAVVFHGEDQLNREYDQTLGSYGAGNHEFSIFAQRETEPFCGAKIFVRFTDGEILKKTISTWSGDDQSHPSEPFENALGFGITEFPEYQSQYGDFHEVSVGATSTRILRITNRSLRTIVSIRDASIFLDGFRYAGGDYPGVGGTCGSTLPPQRHCSIAVEFSPNRVGPLSSLLRIAYRNGEHMQTSSLRLKGNGTMVRGCSVFAMFIGERGGDGFYFVNEDTSISTNDGCRQKLIEGLAGDYKAISASVCPDMKNYLGAPVTYTFRTNFNGVDNPVSELDQVFSCE